jgi:hypothetical protein
VQTAEILAYLESLPSAMFDLPKGTAVAAHEIEAALSNNIFVS